MNSMPSPRRAVLNRRVALHLPHDVERAAQQVFRRLRGAEGRVGRHPTGHIEIAPAAVISPESSLYPYAERWIVLAERAANMAAKG